MAKVTGNPPVINDDVSYSLTGKNVDIVIHDSGVLQYHPEFMVNGQSRVNDIVLDGPYHIDPDYFTTNNFTYTKPDGRTGITTASAEVGGRMLLTVLLLFSQRALYQYLLLTLLRMQWVITLMGQME